MLQDTPCSNPEDSEVTFFQNNHDKLTGLLRDIRRAKEDGKIAFTDSGLMVLEGRAGMTVGGSFHSAVLRHEMVQRAIDDGDPEKEAWAREFVRANGDVFTDRGYFRCQESSDRNLVPNVGLDYVLNVLLYTTTKIATWYHGPFISDWTPVATAESNWAGAGSGPLATELADSQFDESGRQSGTFATTASSQSISSSSSTMITIATGESGIAVYGSTLNETSTVAYNSTDKIVLAATRFSAAKTGLAAADKLDLDYTISASSS